MSLEIPYSVLCDILFKSGSDFEKDLRERYPNSEETVLHQRMIRRTPTRIELKLDDIAEYHNIRNSMSGDKDQESSPQNVPAWTYKLLLQNNKNLTVADRIGYVPQPRTPT